MMYKYIDKVLRTKIMSFLWVVDAHNASLLPKLVFFSRSKGLSLYIYPIKVCVAPCNFFFGLLGLLLPRLDNMISLEITSKMKKGHESSYMLGAPPARALRVVLGYTWILLSYLTPVQNLKFSDNHVQNILGPCVFIDCFSLETRKITNDVILCCRVTSYWNHSWIQTDSSKSTDKMAE